MQVSNLQLLLEKQLHMHLVLLVEMETSKSSLRQAKFNCFLYSGNAMHIKGLALSVPWCMHLWKTHSIWKTIAVFSLMRGLRLP